ncbi:MAG TPA: Wzz/FepE/Etk N-terminal domain-containing protein [Gammaproteobacteria bacterium]|jgi:polysaccharide chain length determinant protein (PEP-CTERM system associated)
MQAQSQENKDSAFSAVSRLWQRRKWLAIATFVLAFAATASFVAALPDIYSADATVLVNPQSPAGDAGGQGAQSQGSRLDAVGEEVLSRDRLLTLINRFDLYPTLRKHASEETLLTRMRQDIQVQRKAGQQQWGQDPTFAFTVGYQGWNPKQVAEVTNALAQAFVDQNNHLRAQQATATLMSLQTQLSDIKHKLDTQSQRINAFRSGHMGELPEQQTTSLAMLQQLDNQLHENAEELNQTVQTNRLASPDRTATQGADPADLPALEDELVTLRTHYTDQYPDVVRLKEQIAALKKAEADQAAEAGTPPAPAADGSLDGTIKSYQDEDSRLRTEIAGYQARLESMPVREQQLQALMQGYNETQDVYSDLLKRYEQVPLPQSPSGQYRVLENAIPPVDPSGPSRLRLLILCLVGSLGLAAVLVFILEQMDPSFHSIEELRAFSRVPVLANIPQIVTRQDVWRSRLRFGTAFASVLIVAVIIGQASSLLGQGNTELVWMLSKHSTPGATTANTAG